MGREFKSVGVIGLGTMGAGIAEVIARSGVDVVGVELDDECLARARAHIEHSTSRALAGDKLDNQTRDALLGRITYTTTLTELAGVDLVIEAIPESFTLKAEVFAQVDSLTRPEVILASNTSSLSVTELGVHTSRPDKVVGMHFFNPAPVLALIEVVRTVVTEADVITDVVTFAERIGKTPVVIGDRAGFIANALLFGYLNHAVRMYEQRYATREDLDAAMRYGCGYPMGPLALLDLIGLDTAYEILESMYQQSRDRLHAPAPLLKQMVAAGLLGRKSACGFYTYDEPDSPNVVVDAQPGQGAASGGAESRPVHSVGVVGTGTMACGIIEVLAKAGYPVVVRARSMDKAEGALATVGKSLDRAVSKGRLTEDDAADVLARISPVTVFSALSDTDVVIEAVAEDIEVKREVFAELDAALKQGAVLATTTSSLPVVECAAATARPADVVGMHFFNPAQAMKLVEVVSTISSAPDALATAREVCAKTGKRPVDCGDRAGFVVNALLFPYLNDAVKMLEAHYADAGDIDTAMKVGCSLPMGPFELLDVVGLDVSLAIQRTLYNEFREPGFAPAPLLEQLVTAGRLGRKTGKGFWDCG